MSKCKAWSAIVALYLLCIAGLGVYILRLRADVMNIMITLDNPGFNRYCQRPDLSVFDRSVCLGSAAVAPHSAAAQSDDDKHDRLFMVYNDGSPYAFYKQWAEDEKWAGRVMAIPTKAVGPLASGPVFRSTIVGRLDGDFMSDMSQVDNLFAQIYQVAGIQLGLQLEFTYPVWKALRATSFAKFQKISGLENETFNSFCNSSKVQQGYIDGKFNSNFECKDPWECTYHTIDAAVADAQAKKVVHLEKLHKANTSMLEECLDQEIGHSGGLFMFSASSDIHAHIHTLLSRKVVETHAIYAANVEFTAEYLLKKYPDCLVVMYSDHGHAENVAIAEWQDHGFEHDENRGFLMLFSEKFKNKKLRRHDQIESNIDVFAHIAMLMRGVNLPLLTENIPTSLYESDAVDRLRLLRAKEMQLESLLFDHKQKLASGEVGGFLSTKNVQSDLTIAELATSLSQPRLEELLVEYETHLRAVMKKCFKPKIDQLLGNWYGTYNADFGVLCLALIAIYGGWRLTLGTLELGERKALLSTVVLLAGWHLLHTTVAQYFNTLDIGIVSFYLLVAASAFWAIEKNKFALGSQFKSDEPDEEIMSTKSAAYLKTMCLGLGIVPPIVSLIFSTVVSKAHLVKHLLYQFAGPASAIGVLLTIFWTIVLTFWAWKTSNESEKTRPEFQKEISSATDKIKPKILRYIQVSFKVLQTYWVLKMLYMLIKYEQKLFRQQNQDHGDEGVNLVQTLYWCLLYTIGASFIGETRFSKLMVVAAFYVDMSFWFNHLGRITYGLFVLPCLAWVMAKYYSLEREKNLEKTTKLMCLALILIAQFGLFQANGEGYTVYVNQRALWRQPTPSPDDDQMWEVPHIMNIKTCAAIFILSILFAAQTEQIHFETNLLVLFHVGFLMIECFFQVKAGVYWTSFYPMIAVHALIPVVFQIVAGIWNLAHHALSYLEGLFYKDQPPFDQSQSQLRKLELSSMSIEQDTDSTN